MHCPIYRQEIGNALFVLSPYAPRALHRFCLVKFLQVRSMYACYPTFLQ